MNLGLSTTLPGLVESKFRAAKTAGSLIFSTTELTTIRTSQGIAFQLRYCPALAKKPTASNPTYDKGGRKFDPFENPPADLLIANVPTTDDPSHRLVLNKFPVIPEHFILATKANKPQTHLLEPDDLGLTYACLKAWEEGQTATGFSTKRLFAFFNSGEHSGASQPHRHLQFLPVEHMRNQESSNDGSDWKLLVDSIMTSSPLSPQPDSSESSTKGDESQFHINTCLPFTHFGLPIPQTPSVSELYGMYLSLVEEATAAVRRHIDHYPGDLQFHSVEDGSLPFSYNLSMTTSAMVICPRRREGCNVGTENSADIVALNGTMLGATLMVKGEQEYKILQQDPTKLDELLGAVGIPIQDEPDNAQEQKNIKL